MKTERTLKEIEVALARYRKFNFVKNIVAFNVNGWSGKLPIFHECDMLVMSKSGYLSEIEIKRSWTDFVADFKKKHKHENRGIIKYFYYCVPEMMLDKVYQKLEEHEVVYTGILTYDENLWIKEHNYRFKNDENSEYQYISNKKIEPFRKLEIEKQLEVARYCAMRAVTLRETIIKLEEKCKKLSTTS